jgi:hypothetical protein
MFQTAVTTFPLPFTPYIQPGNIVSNAYNSAQTKVSFNKNWFAFNATNCATPCGTTNAKPVTFPAVAGYTGKKLPFPTISGSSSSYSFAASSDGIKVAAVGVSNGIYLSIDSGLTWTNTQSAILFSNVCISGDGTRIAASGASNTNLYLILGVSTSSSSTVTWSSVTVSGLPLGAIVMNANGSIMISTKGSNIVKSTDYGNTWPIAYAVTKTWSSLVISNDGAKMAALTSGSSNDFIYVSTDFGANWNPKGTQQIWKNIAMSNDGTSIVTTSSTGLYLSKNSGTDWAIILSTSCVATYNGDSVAISHDGTKIAASCSGILYTSTDSGTTFKTASYSDLTNVRMSSDGTKIGTVTTSFGTATFMVSTDSGNSWTSQAESLNPNTGSSSYLLLTNDGNAIYTGAQYYSMAAWKFTLSNSTATTYNVPSVSYDETVSIASSGAYSLICPSITSPVFFSGSGGALQQNYKFCNLPATTLAALPVNTAWQQAIPSINKAASTGEWQFGSWGFCLDSSQYQTCDAQFKGEVCNTGFFKAMLKDKICGKYKVNGPYYCTSVPDYFSAISLAATTALSVIGVVVMVCALLLQKYFGEEYDGNLEMNNDTGNSKVQDCPSDTVQDTFQENIPEITKEPENSPTVSVSIEMQSNKEKEKEKEKEKNKSKNVSRRSSGVQQPDVVV